MKKCKLVNLTQKKSKEGKDYYIAYVLLFNETDCAMQKIFIDYNKFNAYRPYIDKDITDKVSIDFRYDGSLVLSLS